MIDQFIYVYRLEGEDGKGAFASDSADRDHHIYDKWRWNWLDIERVHRDPYTEGLGNHVKEDRMVFACPTKKHVNLWFNPLLPHLKELGLTLYKYKVFGPVHMGHRKNQCVFSLDDVISKIPVGHRHIMKYFIED